MTELKLARTQKYFRFGDGNDYVVLDGGRVTGRIMLHPQAPSERPWFWSITDPDMNPSTENRSYSLSREDAMVEFKARLDRMAADG